MRVPPQAHMLEDGRLHLQHGPIDLIVGAFGMPGQPDGAAGSASPRARHAEEGCGAARLEARATVERASRRAFGAPQHDEVREAYRAAAARFETILDELCGELALLRSPARPGERRAKGIVARRMEAAVQPFARDTFITPMAAVAGAVAEEILAAILAGALEQNQRASIVLDDPDAHAGRSALLRGRVGEGGADATRSAEAPPPQPLPSRGRGKKASGHDAAQSGLARAYVNNGGDIALHLAPGQSFRIGLVDQPDRPGLFGSASIWAEDDIRGIATSGWRGRSFSLGIADAVTVLAPTAAMADAAATVIANAVDLPGHPAIRRVPACDVQADSDLGRRLVTRNVGDLSPGDVAEALERGAACAADLLRRGLVRGVALHLRGMTTLCFDPPLNGEVAGAKRLTEGDSAAPDRAGPHPGSGLRSDSALPSGEGSTARAAA